jgi:DNA repair exonuclease SbcCD ATPase subunit
LKYKNFLSTGNYSITLDLVKNPTTLVSGDNGAGKSTMLDAITYALFGKSFRGIVLPLLVNSVNNKDCEVELDFTIGADDFKIIRGMKPKKFEIYKNGSLLDQDAKAKDYQKTLEEQILKMTYKSFSQVVILGSSNYVPFMKLSAKDRRLVVENLLDIDVFSIMNTLVRGRLQMATEYVKSIDHKIELTKEKVDAKEQLIKTLEKKSADNVEGYKTDISETESQIKELQDEIKKHQENIDRMLDDIKDKDKVSEKLLENETQERQLKNKIKTIEKNVEFYKENDTCPSCKQDINDTHREEVYKEKEEEKTEIKETIDGLVKDISSIEKELNDINAILEDVQKIEREVSEKQNQISASNQYIKKLQDNISDAMVEGTEVQNAKDELNSLLGEGKGHVADRKEKIEDKHYFEVASMLLRDSGIKAKIIKHYLPIMNKLINKYLSDMDFFCQFDLDENFDETIKSRHRDEFTYHSFSEGERLRIDLSLLLAWREVARLKNSVNCNLLILDEVFDSSLDAVGTEEFLKLIKTFGNRANVFVISHKSDTMTDKFDHHIKFEKKNNFSKINK